MPLFVEDDSPEPTREPTEIRTKYLPDGLIVDLGSSEVPLPPSVFVNGQSYWPRHDAVPRTWSLPPEPGPEVTAVRCMCCGATWVRYDDGELSSWYRKDFGISRRSWRSLVSDHSAPEFPLTDARGEA